MQHFIKSFRAEWIKRRRTGLVTLSVLFGLFIPVAFVLAALYETPYDTPTDNTNFYLDLFEEFIQVLGIFFLPLLLIIIASKIAQVDHKTKGWQLMETQPVPRWTVYFAKFTWLCIALFICLATFLLGSIASSYLCVQLGLVHESYILNIPLATMLGMLGYLYIASLAVLSFQYALSVLFSSFVWPLVIGFGLLLFSLFSQPFNLDLRWFPYNFMAVTAINPQGSQIGSFLLPAQWLSLVYSAIFLAAGYFWYRYDSLNYAFAKAKKTSITTATILLLGITLSYLLITPDTQLPTTKTVVKGTLDTSYPIRNIYMKESFTQDTLYRVPVVDNAFRIEISDALPADFYTLDFDVYQSESVFMGTGDSIQIAQQFYSRKPSIEATGTRIAENLQSPPGLSYSHARSAINNNRKLEDPEYHMKNILEEYEDKIAEATGLITRDHLVARDDFSERNKKEIAIEHLAIWNEYLRKKEVYAPEIPLETTADFEELIATVDLEDTQMLSSRGFMYLVFDDLKLKNTAAINAGKSELELIRELPASDFRDKLLYTSLKEEMEEQMPPALRDSIYNQFITNVQSKRLSELLNQSRKDYNRLARGQKATEIPMIDTDGNPVDLADFRGSYVLLDVWASWCGPCKSQEPYFVKKQQKYKNQNIVFASLNIDDKIADWKEDVAFMSRTVRQLRATDREKLGDDYAISTIPRYILIAPDGTIDNAEFVYPTDSSFDDLLNNKLGLNKS